MTTTVSTPKTLTKSDLSRQVVHGTYYPHIDGIRAFAVLPVVLYHLLASLCPGGFGGVDVFFVISGYLITGGVLRDLAKDQFSIGNFYHRRIRRILPAYFMLITSVFIFGCVVYYISPLLNTCDAALFGSLFTANIYFYVYGGDYFAFGLKDNALLHLWSLSVEEQFYLFIPLLCSIVWKFRRSLVALTLSVLAVLSLVAAIHAMATGQHDRAFYFMHLRAWELLMGALFAMLPTITLIDTLPTKLAFIRLSRLSAAGLLLVLIPYAIYTSTTPFPGIAALPFVIGTALLIRYGQYGWVSKVLCWGPFVNIGKISYSLYLWHWPIMVFWKYITYNQLNAWDYIGMFVLSLLLSWLSWKYIELPVRLAKHGRPGVPSLLPRRAYC